VQWPANLLDPAYGDLVRGAIGAGKYEMPWAPLKSTIPGHSATFQVSGDALKIAGVRINVSAQLQQQIADALGALLLTPRLLDLLWAERAVTLPPSPQPIAATSAAMIAHSARVDALLAKAGGVPKGGIVQTVGKQWVVSNALEAHPGRAENMGWHFAGPTFGGQAFEPSPTLPGVRLIQGPGWAHDIHHLDYSQVCCLVHRSCVVDGESRDLADVVRDAALAPLATGPEGVLRILRQPGVPIYACAAITPPSGVTAASDGSDGTSVCAAVPPMAGGFPWGPALIGAGAAATAAALWAAWRWHARQRAHPNPIRLNKTQRHALDVVAMMDREGKTTIMPARLAEQLRRMGFVTVVRAAPYGEAIVRLTDGGRAWLSSARSSTGAKFVVWWRDPDADGAWRVYSAPTSRTRADALAQKVTYFLAPRWGLPNLPTKVLPEGATP
jgi:hypothetical protein